MNEKPYQHGSENKGKATALQVRIALLKRGETLNSWAVKHGYSTATVWRAAHRGGRRKASQRIIAHLMADLRTEGKRS